MEAKDLLKCNFCEQRFSKRDHRKRHERSHTNTKPYACNLCGRKYARSDVLLRHVRLHAEKDNILPPSSQRSSHPRLHLPTDADETDADQSLDAAAAAAAAHATDAFPAYAHEQLATEPSFAPPHEHHFHAAPQHHPSDSAHFPFAEGPDDSLAHSTSEDRVDTVPNDDDDAYGVELLRTLGQPQHRNQQHPGAPQSGYPSSQHPHLLDHHGRFTLHHPQPPSQAPSDSLSAQPTPAFSFPHQSLPDSTSRFPRHLPHDPHYPHYPHHPSFNSTEHFHDGEHTVDQQTQTPSQQRQQPHQQQPQQPPPPQQQDSVLVWPDQSVSRPPQPTNNSFLDLSSLFRRFSPQPDIRGSSPVTQLWLTRTSPSNIYSNQTYLQPGIPPSRHVDHAATSRIWQRLESGSLKYEASLPPMTLINELIDLYFEYWHPLWPILHPPTFDAPSANSLLLLGLCSLGALFLDTPDHFNFSLNLSNKLLEHVSAAMSPTLCPTFDPHDNDILEICQASMLRQLYGLASGDRKSLQSGYLFHASPANLAREAGLLDPVPIEQFTDENIDLHTRWHRWARNESRKRTAFAFLLNDLYFSHLFISSPHFTAGSISFPLPSSEEPFLATNADAWSERMHNVPMPTTPYYELAMNLFTDRLPVFLKPAQLTPFGLQTLIGSIFAVVLSTRFSRRQLDQDIVTSPAALIPLANALTSALVALPDNQHDVMSAGVLWNAAWIHLLVDMRAAELACGREGSGQRDISINYFRAWSTSPRARRALLHAVDTCSRVKETTDRRDYDVHVLTSLFHSWMVIRVYLKLHNNPSNVFVPKGPIDWKSLGNVGLTGMSVPQAHELAPEMQDIAFWIENGGYPRGHTPDHMQSSIKMEPGGSGPGGVMNNSVRTRGAAAAAAAQTNGIPGKKLTTVHAFTWMSEMEPLIKGTSSFPLRNALGALMETIQQNDPLLIK